MATDDDPCFPVCLTDAETRVRRRSQRRSRCWSADSSANQNAPPGDGSIDVEDVALTVKREETARKTAGSIVVDYDEGVPERSRTALLREPDDALAQAVKAVAAECGPGACDPLDLFAFAELAIDADRERSVTTPKTPGSTRRGKSIILTTATKTAPNELFAEETPEEAPAVERCSATPKLCQCEVRQHKCPESCWLVANGSVYDVTGMLASHPAGPRSILRKAGGADCTKDMKFHSKMARKMLEKCFIGALVPCGEDPVVDAPEGACAIM